MARLRTLKPRLTMFDISTVKVPPKFANGFYFSPEWKAIKAQVHRRSGGICEAPGCNRPAVVCDHVVSRKDGGADHADNCRDLCRLHDNKVKEDHTGARRSGGRL